MKHYGMDSSLLQEYLLQLLKKENSLLAIASEASNANANRTPAASKSNGMHRYPVKTTVPEYPASLTPG